MDAGEIIAVALIALIIGGAVAYVIKIKKSGGKCIGCPHRKTCAKKSCDCTEKENTDK